MKNSILPILLFLAAGSRLGQGLECFDCDFQWLQFEVNGTVIENISPVGGKRCATDPDVSYPLIEAKMCGDGEVCVNTYVSGTYDDPELGDVSFWAVTRDCAPKPSGMDGDCAYGSDVPGMDPGISLDPSSEACYCDSGDLCNSKAYDGSSPEGSEGPGGSEGAASRLAFSTSCILAIVIAVQAVDI